MSAIDLSLMTRVFCDRYTPKLATFERGPPQLDESASDIGQVDIEAVVDALDGETLLQADDGLRLPLHELDSAELTGEYVLYREEDRRTIIQYHKSLVDRTAYEFPSQAATSAIGWRLRFWTSAFEPPSSPSYMDGDGDSGVSAIVETIPREIDGDSWDRSRREEFFDHLRAFVTAQKDQDREESIGRYNTFDQQVYQRREGGLHNAVPVYRDTSPRQTRWYVSAPTDDDEDGETREYICAETTLWEGTEVMIDTPPWANSPSGLPVLGEIVDSETRGLTFVLSEDADDRQQAARTLTRSFQNDEYVVGLYPSFNPLPYDRELDCIDAVQARYGKLRPIAGNTSLSFTPLRALDTDVEGLNESQTHAALKAIAADDLALMHGPPGTGKTRTLVALIRELVVERDKRVLACAHSNQATDNLLVGGSTLDEPADGSLHAMDIADELQIARVGSGSTNPVVNRRYGGRSATHANVVGATMSAAAEFDVDEFDVAIVDEASQASIPATFAPWLAAERLVLAGDHKQLPPYASDDMRERDLEVSLYEHLVDRYGEDCAHLLDTQYRMAEQISAFPSQAFYDGRVQTADSGDERVLSSYPPVTAHHLAGTEIQRYGTSYANEAEAAVIATHVRELRDAGISQAEIGVITGYTGQITTVRGALDDLTIETNDIVVDTVDSFQGGERRVILVSFVRSNDDSRAGFLSHPDIGPRRLNVALTRAKDRLVVVGNWDTLATPEPHRKCCSDVYDAYRTWLLENDCFEPVDVLSVAE